MDMRSKPASRASRSIQKGCISPSRTPYSRDSARDFSASEWPSPGSASTSRPPGDSTRRASRRAARRPARDGARQRPRSQPRTTRPAKGSAVMSDLARAGQTGPPVRSDPARAGAGGRQVQRDGSQTEAQEEIAHPAWSAAEVEDARAGRDVEVGRCRHEHVQQAQALGPVLGREGLGPLPHEVAFVRVALGPPPPRRRAGTPAEARTSRRPPRRIGRPRTTERRPEGASRRASVARPGTRATAAWAPRLRARAASARHAEQARPVASRLHAAARERRRRGHARRAGTGRGAERAARGRARGPGTRRGRDAAAVRTMKQRSTSPFAIERLDQPPAVSHRRQPLAGPAGGRAPGRAATRGATRSDRSARPGPSRRARGCACASRRGA